MCNLYANTLPSDAMRKLFDVEAERDHLGNLPVLDALYPRQEVPVLCLDAEGARALGRMHWGFLLPRTSRKTGAPLLPKAVNNARDDRIRASAFWRESFERRRCLIPATAFCEPKGRNPATYHWFALKGAAPRPPFVFAGLWRRWRGDYRGARVDLATCALVTTRPNALVAPIHPDRMPVILPREGWETWLTGTPEAAAELCRPYPAEAMRIVDAAEEETSREAPA